MTAHVRTPTETLVENGSLAAALGGLKGVLT